VLNEGAAESMGSCKGYELFRVIRCSRLMHGMVADVAWFTGGNDPVELHGGRVKEARSGVYFGLYREMGRVLDDEDIGPQTPVGRITRLRWLGSTSDFTSLAKASKKELGNAKYNRLMDMLSSDDGSDADTQ